MSAVVAAVHATEPRWPDSIRVEVALESTARTYRDDAATGDGVDGATAAVYSEVALVLFQLARELREARCATGGGD